MPDQDKPTPVPVPNAAPPASPDFKPQVSAAPPTLGDSPPLMADPPILNPYNPGTPFNDFVAGARGKLKIMPPTSPSGVAPPAQPIELPIDQITRDDVVQTDDITHSMAGGWAIPLANIKSFKGQIVCTYDALNVPGTIGTNTSAYNPFVVGTYLTIYEYIDGTTLLKYNALIEQISTGTGPKIATVKLTISFMSVGKPVTLPTASLTMAAAPFN